MENNEIESGENLTDQQMEYVELFQEKMNQFVLAKEKEREFLESHPELIEQGMEISMNPINEIYRFRESYYDELIVDVTPWINGYIAGFDGLTRVTMGTVMPKFGILNPVGNASSCWNSGVKGKSIMDDSNGLIRCHSCADATNTGNFVTTDLSAGFLNWEFKSGTQKQWIGIMFSHLLSFEYAYEFQANEPRSYIIFDATIIGSVIESDIDGTNKKTILSNENFLVFKEKFNTDKHSPTSGSQKKYTKNQIKSIEFQMNPNKLYNIYIAVRNYTSAWHGKAALKIGYQHLPFA